MRTFFFLLCLPWAALAAEPPALSTFDCEARYLAEWPDPAAQAAAVKTEAAMASGQLALELANVDALHNLALYQFQQYRYAETNVNAARVLDIWKQQTPSALLAARMRVQAQRYHRQTDCKNAEDLYGLALDVATRSGADGRAVSLAVMSDLIHLYRATKRAPQAAELLGRMSAAVDADPALGAQAPEALLLLSDHAYRARNVSLAGKHARAALIALDSAAVPSPRLQINALNELAAALYAQGQIVEGDLLRERAGKLMRAGMVGPPRPVRAPESLAAIFRRGDFDGAIAKGREHLTQLEADETRLAAALAELEAKPDNDAVRKRDIESKRKWLQSSRKAMLPALADLAEVYHSQQRLAEAEPLYRRALAKLGDANASHSLVAGRVWSDLGILLRTRGEFAEAASCQQNALTIVAADLGNDHPDAVAAQAELTWLAARK